MTSLRRFAFTVALLGPLYAPAQTVNEGSIEGVVTDATGAVIIGAVVTAANVNTGWSLVSVTNEHGLFRFLVVPVGNYTVTTQQPNFAPAVQRDVAVQPGGRIHLAVTLRVASQTESVNVNTSHLLETTRSGMSTDLDDRLIADLPVNGRNFQDFVQAIPGLVRGPGGIPRFGGQNFGDLTLVDGANDTNPQSGVNFVTLPFQFSLAGVHEFQVDLGGYSAELGRSSTGVVNAVTATGANDFHGQIFWFFRDKAFNATDTVRKRSGTGKEPLHVHQFGAAFGGPIRKNRMFFYGAYDAQRRNLQNGTFVRLPENFAFSSNAATAAFQRQALDYLQARAAPYRQTDDEDAYFARTDWELTSAQRLMARWNSARARSRNGNGSNPQSSLEQAATTHADNDAFAASLTSALSSTALNVFRLNYLHVANRSAGNSVNPRADVREAGQTVLIVGRAVNAPQRNFSHQIHASDTVSLSRGRHALKFGQDSIFTNATNHTVRNFYGAYVFNTLQSFGRSLAGTTGVATSYTQSFSGFSEPGVVSHSDSRDFDAFITDQWQVRSGLTFELGARYDVQIMAKPPVRNPAVALRNAGLDTSFRPLDLTKLSPRIGVAWSPGRTQHLVLRSAYGLYPGWTVGNLALRAHFQNGISVQTRQFRAGTPTATSIPAYPNTACGIPDSEGAVPTCPAPVPGQDVLMLFSKQFQQPYNQHATVGFEQQVGTDLAFSATYLMVKGTHLTRWRDVNLAAPVPATIKIAGTSTPLLYNNYSSPRPITGFDRILAIEATGNSLYHGLTTQLTKRFSHGFQFLAGYTLSKVLDDHPEPLFFDPGSNVETILLSDFSDARRDRGPGVADVRHRFVLSGVWDLHYADHLPSPARQFLSDWELSGIFSTQSGLPYSGAVLGTDLNSDGSTFNDRTPGQPRNRFRIAPSYIWDQRVTRNVRLTEHLRLQLIGEAFNLLNHSNYTVTLPLVSQYSRSTSAADCGIAGTPCLVPQSSFGTPTDSTGPRVLQFAAKVFF